MGTGEVEGGVRLSSQWSRMPVGHATSPCSQTYWQEQCRCSCSLFSWQEGTAGAAGEDATAAARPGDIARRRAWCERPPSG